MKKLSRIAVSEEGVQTLKSMAVKITKKVRQSDIMCSEGRKKTYIKNKG